jgi:thiol:disulfide interchange protein DsbA
MKNKTNLTLISTFVFVSCLFLSSAFVSAADFVEGTHYNELTTPINDNLNSTKEVREFFSFYCPACYRHEPIIGELKAKIPDNIALIKNHIDGMPGRDMAIEQALSKALLTAKLLKVEDQIATAIFKYIYVNKATFTNEKDIKNIFLLHGIEEQRFDTVFNSFSVKTGVNKMKKNTETLRNQGISSVPTVIVNGKYKVETGAIKSKEQYIELVLYLLNH